jgi:hypothetical protein
MINTRFFSPKTIKSLKIRPFYRVGKQTLRLYGIKGEFYHEKQEG